MRPRRDLVGLGWVASEDLSDYRSLGRGPGCVRVPATTLSHPCEQRELALTNGLGHYSFLWHRGCAFLPGRQALKELPLKLLEIL